MGFRWISIYELSHVLMNKCMIGYTLFKRSINFFTWKVTINKKVSYFKKIRLVSELLNWITSISKNTFFTIKKSYRTFSRAGIFETSINGNVAGLCSKLGNVYCFFIFRTSNNWTCLLYTSDAADDC